MSGTKERVRLQSKELCSSLGALKSRHPWQATPFPATGCPEAQQLTGMLPCISAQLGADSLTRVRRMVEGISG